MGPGVVHQGGVPGVSLQDGNEVPAGGEAVVYVPVTLIRPSRFQPRVAVREAELAELVESIRAQGVLQPVLVRPGQGHYELVAGERRWRAAIVAGLQEVPAVVRRMGDREAALAALAENVQRADLHFLEEAAAYRRVMEGFGLTQEELARQVGKSQPAIANKLRLLALPEEVRTRISREMISERHARELLRLSDPAVQMRVLDEVVRRGLTVRETEALVGRLKGGGGRRRPRLAAVNDWRLFVNAVREVARRAREAGLAVELEEAVDQHGMEVRLRIGRGRGAAREERRARTRRGGAGR